MKKEADIAELLIYGNIGEYNTTTDDFARQFKQLEMKNQRVNVRINSEGGAVFHGITIFNALKHSRSDVHIYIDGVAASIAAVIAMCGKPLHMSRHARMMTHRVSGWISGDAETIRTQADQMDSLNNTLANMIAERTGLRPEDVHRKYLQKGVDTWFTAQEALTANLIDDIYDDVVQSVSNKYITYNAGKSILIEDLVKMHWDELDKKNLLPHLKAHSFDLFKTKFKARFGSEYRIQ